jgi:hypothetical protein
MQVDTGRPPFPQPTYFYKRRRWKLSEIVNYERACAELPPIEVDPLDDVWLTSAQVRERFNASSMWLWRHTTGARRQAEAGA